jgi:hypothetical protein
LHAGEELAHAWNSRLLFKPLIASIPGFGAIVVSLNEPVHVLPPLLNYTTHQLQETFQ